MHIFISYSHRDKEFVRLFYRKLRESDQKTWVDWMCIRDAMDWWKAVKSGIEASKLFVFIISPNSIISEVCNQEIEYAVKYNKRLVPIVLNKDFDKQQVPSVLLKQDWLLFSEINGLDSNIQEIIKTINTN